MPTSHLIRKDPLEKDVEKRICDRAKSKGYLAYKFTSPARRSVPDRMFINRHGFIFFMELKRLGEKPTPSQLREHATLRNNGALVFVVDNKEQGYQIIDQFCNHYPAR